jgi:large subunit ribosomal protein L10
VKDGYVEGAHRRRGRGEPCYPAQREELVAKALGGLNAPITGFVHVLNANLRGLVVALNAIAEKQAS